MKIAVLGTGRMGTALAEKLLASGHIVVVWNRSPQRTKGAVSAGASEARTVQDAVKGAEAVLLSLTDDAAVRQVALAEGGVRDSIGDGVPYIECSTVSPQLTEELSGIFPNFAAVPVLGGPAAIASGQATYLVGASDATFQRVRPVVEAFGGNLRRYASVPLASAAKLAANFMLLSGAVALAEAFSVGRAGGLSDAQLRELLEGVVAPNLRTRFDALLAGPSDGWFSVELGEKDVALAVELAKRSGADLGLGNATADAYRRSAAEGHAGEDIAAVRDLYLATPPGSRGSR